MSTEHTPTEHPATGFVITREVTGNRGRYAITLGEGAGAEVAQLTYAIAAPDRVIADHTGVPPAFRGSGAALALVERLVADARAEGFKIVPLCSYIDAQRRKHPNWADVFTSQ